MRALVFFALLALSLNPVVLAAAVPTYHLTDLGTLGGTDSYVNAINNLGQMTGQTSKSGAVTTFGFVYSDGKMLDLGNLGGAETTGWAINDAGQVAGSSDYHLLSNHAFRYSNGAMQDLGALPVTNFSVSSGSGINAAGVVVGSSVNDDIANTSVPVIFNNGAVTPLPTFGGTDGTATAINDSGTVVGSSYLSAPGVYHAFRYTNGVMSDLATLGGSTSAATAVNNDGVIVGTSRGTDNIDHAFMYANGKMNPLPSVIPGNESKGFGLNDAGQVVGATTVSGKSHPFLYTAGSMTDLTTVLDSSATGYALSAAYDINDSSWIVAGAYNAAGKARAVLLTPGGQDAAHPMLPQSTSNGARHFFNGPTGVWFDPPGGDYFDYTMTGSSLFTDILNFPGGFDQPFTVSAGGTELGAFSAGQSVHFATFSALLGTQLIDGQGVSGFRISGISPGNPGAFPVQLAFNTATASFDVSPVPEPTSLTALAALAAAGLLRRRSR